MLKLTIENCLTGPLAHKSTLKLLEEKIKRCVTLDEASIAIQKIPNLSVYNGGAHVAVHPTYQGQFADGSCRIAIVTATA